MAAPKREQFKNAASNQLNGAINNSTTSVTVDDGSVFPSVGNFRILIDTEIMLVTARSGNVLTVVRGQESTAAASHADDAKVTHIVTQASLLRALKDNVPFADSSRPILGSLTAADGSILTASSFAWVNQGSSTVADADGGLYIETPGATGYNIRLLKKAPPSPPYSIVAGIVPSLALNGATGQPACGIAFRESSSGKIFTIGVEVINDKMPSYLVVKNASATSLTTQNKTGEWFAPAAPFWLKIEDDNTNLKFYGSGNGRNWVQWFSESRTTFLLGGPDEVGVWINQNGSNDLASAMDLVHWSEL
jgi:hypothetical protein